MAFKSNGLILILTFVVLFAVFKTFLTSDFFNPKDNNLIDKKLNTPLSISGLTSSYYQKNKLISRFKAEKFIIRPRVYKFFRVRNVNEIRLGNVSINDYYYDFEKKEGDSNIDNSIKFLLGLEPNEKFNNDLFLSGVGNIQRTVINTYEWNIFFNGKIKIELKAKNGIIKNNTARFLTAQLRLININRIINSKLIIYEQDRKIFRIPKFRNGRDLELPLDDYIK